MADSVADKGLIIRHHERQEVELPAEFVVAERHAAQLRFSAKAETASPNALLCTVVDVSPGGVGIISRYFLPRMLEGTIRVFREGGLTPDDVLLEQRVKVRRIEMIGREPRFAIGLAFAERAPDIDKRIGELLGELERTRGAGGEASHA